MVKVDHQQEKHALKVLKRIRASKRDNERDRLVRQYLNSFDAKLKATHDAWSAMKAARRPALAKLPSIASGVDPWAGSDEPARVHRVAKGTAGDYRDIVEFGIQNRARQYLVKNVLSAMVELHPCQFLLHGGTHEAISQTAKALQSGFQWAIEIDIKKCYPSFGGEELIQLLPLPKDVTRKVIISDCLHLVPGNLLYYHGPEGDFEGDQFTLASALSAARRGIPQGSAASPLVAEAMIAIALKHIPTLGVIIAFADNVLLMAKSESDVVSMTLALLAALEAHPVGRLRPSGKTFKPGQRIEFLGHVLSLKNGSVRIDPSDENRQEFQSRFSKELAYLKKAKLSPLAHSRRCHELKKYVNSWTRGGFRLCHGVEEHRKTLLQKVKAVEDLV